MDAPVFTSVAAGSRLYASSALPAGGFAGYWSSATASFGSTATLAQTWADVGGFYVVAQRLPDDLPAFAGELALLAPRLSPTGLLRVLWLANAEGSTWNYWPASFLTALPVGAPSGAWSLIMPGQLNLGAYSVQLAAGSRLTLRSDTGGHGLLLPAASASFWHGDFNLAARATVSLALAGPAVGALALPLTLQPQQIDPCDQLGVMLRYATTPDPDDAQAVAQNLARYLSMPVLRLHSGSLPVTLYFDPSAPMGAQRSYMDLAPAGGVPYALASAFVTTLGYAVLLTPRTGLAASRSGRLAFCKSPLYAVEGENQGSEVFHLAPDGCFSIGVQVPVSVRALRDSQLDANQSPDSDHWMFGDSGAEYAALQSSSTDVLVFAAGGAAYVPDDPPDGTPALVGTATTAHMTLLPGVPGDGLTYFAQPLQAPLFTAATGLGTGFFAFHPMPAGTLPAQAQMAEPASLAFPAGAYRWLATDDIALARRLEAAVLAPSRRTVIGGLSQQGLPPAPDPATLPLASTPQGLLAQLSSDSLAWAGVLFANLPSSGQALSFTPVRERFAQALQANQLFFVVADAQEFLRQSGAGSGGLDCTLDGWTFRLDPQQWRSPAGADPTLMLFKYCNRRLTELVDDTSAWGWPQAAGDLSQTQQQLQALLEKARQRAQVQPLVPGDPYAIFYNQVANNPVWNGVLFFNAPVDLGLMPRDLKFLAAGIDPTKFYAHHVGFSVTPVTASSAGILTPGQTAAFGLIDYEDTQSLAPSSTVPFGFKTMHLEIRFANARIADFSAQCELMVNRLFGAPLAKQDASRGNNLVMNGSCQRVAGLPAYSFALAGENVFDAQGSALVSVQVLAVRIETAAQSEDEDSVTANFTLQGSLRFRELANFDMYSYGADAAGEDGFLRFTGLSIRMQFLLSAPAQQTFSAFESATTLDAANSRVRRTSLAGNFPLKITGIAIAPVGSDGTGQTPEQMGFVSIACPLDQTPMTAPWWGLLFTVDLGALGALSGSVGLNMTVLTAWSTGAGDDVPVYLGLKLASFVPGAGSLPLQGVLKLGFRGFEFIAYVPAPGEVGYQLWMRRFALSVLVWSFPPGNADLVLFGAPGNPAGSLGWYAAYDGKPASKPLSTIEPARRLASGRRTPPVA